MYRTHNDPPKGNHMAPFISAIVIGTNQARGQTPLPYAEADARKVASLLASRGAVAPDNIVLLLGANATKSKLQKAFRQVRGSRFVIIYTMLHGGAAGVALADQMYGWRHLRRNLGDVGAQSILFLGDSCHAGNIVVGLRGLGGLEADWAGTMTESLPGLRFLLASSADDTTFWRHDLQGGVFTWALTQAALMPVAGDLGDEDRFVSDGMLFDRLDRLAARHDVTPVAYGPIGDFPVFRANDRTLGHAAISNVVYDRSGIVAQVDLVERRLLPTFLTATIYDDLGIALGAIPARIHTTESFDTGIVRLSLPLSTIARSPLARTEIPGGGLINLRWHLELTDERRRVLASDVYATTYRLAA